MPSASRASYTWRSKKVSENQVVVHVRDSGCGIPEENLKTIFQPFFTTKGDKGTGIGLWVIKGIVDKLGGKIEVETSTTGDNRNLLQHFPSRHSGKRHRRIDAQRRRRSGRLLAASLAESLPRLSSFLHVPAQRFLRSTPASLSEYSAFTAVVQ